MKILVLAGGYDQIALISELKKYGHEILLADYLEKPQAKDVADKFFRISTLDEATIYNLAKTEKVELVTTACTDQALLTVAHVSESLGLPCYISAETARNVTNKAYMKKVFVKNKILTAAFVLLENRTKWKEQLSDEGEFPLVVKPCDCNSSKGVVKVKNREELETAVNAAFELSRDEKVIVEAYIDGREISIDAWADMEQVKVLSVSETVKVPNRDASFTICKSIYPVKDIDIYYDKIQQTVNDIAKAFKLRNCPLLIQALLCDDGIYVIEFSARMGGGTKYKLIEYMSGIDIMNIYVQRVLGNECQILWPKPARKYMELIYIYAENGIVGKLVNFDELKKERVIADYFLYKSIGSVIEHQSTSNDRVAGVLIIDTEKAGIEVKKNIIRERLDILDHDNSIICREWI